MASSAHSSLQKFLASVDHTAGGEGDGSAQAGSLGLLTDSDLQAEHCLSALAHSGESVVQELLPFRAI